MNHTRHTHLHQRDHLEILELSGCLGVSGDLTGSSSAICGGSMKMVNGCLYSVTGSLGSSSAIREGFMSP